jgi:hypothetical protein
MLAAMLGMAPGGTAAGLSTRDLRFESRATIRDGKRRMAYSGATWRHAIIHIRTADDAHGDTSLTDKAACCLHSASLGAGRPQVRQGFQPPAVARAANAGGLLWRPRSEATIRKAMGTAFTRHAGSPNAIIEDVRGMTHRALAATAGAPLEYLKRPGLPARLAACT